MPYGGSTMPSEYCLSLHPAKYLLQSPKINVIICISFYKDLKIPAVVFDYDENIQNFYLLSDLIICRAGAGTLFEIEFFRKKCLVIPLVAASTSHQVYNAQAMAEQYPDLFKIMSQDELVPDKFNDAVSQGLNVS